MEASFNRNEIVQNLGAEKIYEIIIYGREEFQASLYNEIIKVFFQRLSEENMDFFQFAKSNNFEKIEIFLEAATTYNQVNQLFDNIKNPAQKIQLLNLFISNIIKQKNIENAITLAEITTNIKDNTLLNFLENKIIEIFNETQDLTVKNIFGLLFSNLIDQRSQNLTNKQFFNTFDKEKYELPVIDRVPSSEIFDSEGRNTQQYFFYNDADGRTSFENFLKKYQIDSRWEIYDRNSFVIIHAKNPETSKQILIYANKPEFDGITDKNKNAIKDIKADMEIFDPPLTPAITVHRGHFFHAWKTIQYLSLTAKIVLFGSCESYFNFANVLFKSPDADIISTTGEGTRFINDPFFKIINDEILAGKDIVWKDVWEKAAAAESSHKRYEQLKDDPRFQYYVRPDENFRVRFVKKFKELEQG